MQAYSEQQPLIQPYPQQQQQQPYFHPPQNNNVGGGGVPMGIQPAPPQLVGPYVPPPIPTQFLQMQPTPLGPPEIRVVSTFEIKEGSPTATTTSSEGTLGGVGGLQMDVQDLYENTHWASQNKLNLIFTLAVLGSVVALIVFGLVLPKRNDFDLIICAVVAGVSVVAYYIESACSSTRQYLSGMTNPQGIHGHIHSVRSSPPILCFHVVCYHYETITTVSRDSNGRENVSTRTEKRVTHRESEHFIYDCWDDVSGILIGVGDLYRLTRIRFHKTYVFADEHTQYAWEGQARAIQDRNRCRDTHMDFWHCLDIPGYEHRMLAVNGEKNDLPACLGIGWYSLCSLVFCGYIYRSWFNNISTRQSYEFVKRVKRHHHY